MVFFVKYCHVLLYSAHKCVVGAAEAFFPFVGGFPFFYTLGHFFDEGWDGVAYGAYGADSFAAAEDSSVGGESDLVAAEVFGGESVSFVHDGTHFLFC